MKRRAQKTDLAHEIRRLQKTQALLIAIHNASNYGVEFEVADALTVICDLVEETLAGLDRVEVADSN